MKEPDWKKMYLTLMSGILDASELMHVLPENDRAQERLNKAIRDAEELYLQTEE